MELQLGRNVNLKYILYLAWPAIVQEGLNVVVSYVDTAMVGALGAGASATVGLTTSVVWLICSIAIALGMGVLAVCAQADGAGDKERMQKAGQQALFLTLIVGSLLTIICVAVSPFIPGWLGADVSIRAEASAYFGIISMPLLFRTAVLIFSSALRGVSDMRTPMLINLYMNMVNIALNFVLIYPTREYFGITVFGAGLGVRGAATATAISFVFGGILMFRRYYRNSAFEFGKTGFHFDKRTMGDCLKIGIPVVMSRSVLCLGYITFASIVAKLGVIPFAAHSIALQAEQAFYIPGYGFQSAASTLVGNAIGEKNEEKVKQTAWLISAITFGLMLVAGILLFFNAKRLVGIFTPDAEVIELGAKVLRIVSVSEPIYGVLVIMEGTFNGMGDTKAPFVFSLITMWGLRIGGSFIMIHVLGLGLEAVWVMMVVDNVCRCGLLLQRFVRGGWKYRISRMCLTGMEKHGK